MNKLTADEILTWVARNVHKWEDAQQIVGDQREFFYNSASFWDDRIDFTGCAARTITRNQWLARRAELQNKPSWKDAPEWAEWLAQHSTGFWCWGNGAAKTASNDVWYSPALGKTEWSGMAGEVLGDWRDTLERRPADLSEPAVTERLTEATQNVLAAVPELMREKYKFDRGVTAHSILEAAGGHMRDRAATYDKPEGERSMGATVEAFRAITGHKLTEEQGWLFMQLLKAVRSQQGAYRADSYEDGCAYVSLAGEAAARERGGAQ